MSHLRYFPAVMLSVAAILSPAARAAEPPAAATPRVWAQKGIFVYRVKSGTGAWCQADARPRNFFHVMRLAREIFSIIKTMAAKHFF